TIIEDSSFTVTWTTSYASTSQVIYGKEGESHTLDLTDNLGSPPKYGYANTTPEYDIISKTTNHSVTVSGLAPGVVYYYRVVSHGSLAISYEYTLVTDKKAVNTPEKMFFAAETGTGAKLQEGNEISTNQNISAYIPVEKPTEIATATATELGTKTETTAKKVASTAVSTRTSKTNNSSLFQAGLFGGFMNILSFGTGAEWLSVLMLILLVAVMICIIVYFVKKNSNKKEKL
ncbi:MAG: fibronectin type III domain-containing protein, partial [bacterium]|nr:fibronectin type III domain-containing protein [bacterium]